MRNGLFRIFKRFRREERELKKFFKELVNPLQPIEYLSHPADEILRAYLAGGLSNRWRFDEPQISAQLTQGKLNDWQRAEVSAHVMTCLPCSQKISKWRAAEGVQPKPAEQPRRALRWAFKLGTLMAGAGAVGFLIWLLLVLLNPIPKQTVFGQVRNPCESAKCGGDLE